MEKERVDTIHKFLDYEIRSSWWVKHISWDWVQDLFGKYFAWKVRRKYGRYKLSKMWEKRLKNKQPLV